MKKRRSERERDQLARQKGSGLYALPLTHPTPKAPGPSGGLRYALLDISRELLQSNRTCCRGSISSIASKSCRSPRRFLTSPSSISPLQAHLWSATVLQSGVGCFSPSHGCAIHVTIPYDIFRIFTAFDLSFTFLIPRSQDIPISSSYFHVLTWLERLVRRSPTCDRQSPLAEHISQSQSAPPLRGCLRRGRPDCGYI